MSATCASGRVPPVPHVIRSELEPDQARVADCASVGGTVPPAVQDPTPDSKSAFAADSRFLADVGG